MTCIRDALANTLRKVQKKRAGIAIAAGKAEDDIIDNILGMDERGRGTSAGDNSCSFDVTKSSETTSKECRVYGSSPWQGSSGGKSAGAQVAQRDYSVMTWVCRGRFVTPPGRQITGA